MKLSIAMCTYNGADFLKEQLDSFVRQTRLPDELVIGDDCSTDETVEIIENFAARAPFPVRFSVNQTNLGTIKNFDRAICACTGDLIFLSDQDDVWLPEKLRRFEEKFAADEAVGLVFCDAELVDENLKPLNLRNWQTVGFTEKLQKKFSQSGGAFPILLYHNVISGCSLAFRAEYKNLVSPIPEDLHLILHDHWLGIVLSAVSKLGVISEPLIKYRQHPKQQVGAIETAIEYSPKNGFQPFSYSNLFSRIETKYSFEDILARLKELQKRLAATPAEVEVYGTVLEDLAQHIAHLRSRTAVQNGLRGYFLTVVKELAAYRYHRYSNGFGSAVKDLLS